ncbi:MAG: hypothetical protein RBS96_07950 [Dehalococcoidales bacterium]|jgi:hypothetical protein|nr:hypothetical protein [Dehalococcoidales bacterium]
MAIVTGQTWEAEIPHEPGEKITFRRLSWKEWDKALEAKQASSLENISKISGDVFKALKDVESAGTQRNPGDKFDKGIVLEASIVGWTYPEKVNRDTINALDDATADWAYQEIVKTLKPRTDTEQKNG